MFLFSVKEILKYAVSHSGSQNWNFLNLVLAHLQFSIPNVRFVFRKLLFQRKFTVTELIYCLFTVSTIQTVNGFGNFISNLILQTRKLRVF